MVYSKRCDVLKQGVGDEIVEGSVMAIAIQEEVDQNYRAFQAHLPQLLATYRGKFALMRECTIVEFFDTARDAYVAGRKLFATDQLFSIQEVIDTPIQLGFFSYATL
jgi:hypothetical protein